MIADHPGSGASEGPPRRDRPPGCGRTRQPPDYETRPRARRSGGASADPAPARRGRRGTRKRTRDPRFPALRAFPARTCGDRSWRGSQARLRGFRKGGSRALGPAGGWRAVVDATRGHKGVRAPISRADGHPGAPAGVHPSEVGRRSGPRPARAGQGRRTNPGRPRGPSPHGWARRRAGPPPAGPREQSALRPADGRGDKKQEKAVRNTGRIVFPRFLSSGRKTG